MLKLRRSQHRLIFNMGIPILVRRHLYIEMAPWSAYLPACLCLPLSACICLPTLACMPPTHFPKLYIMVGLGAPYCDEWLYNAFQKYWEGDWEWLEKNNQPIMSWDNAVVISRALEEIAFSMSAWHHMLRSAIMIVLECPASFPLFIILTCVHVTK